ncbi:MAG TPA: glycoside hydrolase family 16 protein [Gaiellaceae bacterium]|nr:glycoside hydrolase family 16 protein [Gaiellaceae bacterium]
MPRQVAAAVALMLLFAGVGTSALLTRALAEQRSLTAVQHEKRLGPKPTPHWYWRWSEWRLGEGYAKGRPLARGLRPAQAPQRIPSWAWQRLHFFQAARAALATERQGGRKRHGPPPTTTAAGPTGTTATTTTDTSTTDTTPTTTATTTTTPTPSSQLVFDDEFDGGAGARPDPAKWYTFGNVCPRGTNWQYSCLKSSNAFQDGAGHLVLRVTGGTQGRPYDGAEISPSPLNGYPSTNVKYKFPPGSRLEVRAKFAPGAGLWETLWSVAPDSVTQDELELDMQEWRGSKPTLDDCHTHYSVEFGHLLDTGEDLSSGWHTYWMNYYRDHVVFGVDNMVCGQTALSLALPETPILWNMVPPPTTGPGTGGPPPAADIPADMKVDYVRVYALSG